MERWRRSEKQSSTPIGISDSQWCVICGVVERLVILDHHTEIHSDRKYHRGLAHVLIWERWGSHWNEEAVPLPLQALWRTFKASLIHSLLFSLCILVEEGQTFHCWLLKGSKSLQEKANGPALVKAIETVLTKGSHMHLYALWCTSSMVCYLLLAFPCRCLNCLPQKAIINTL
jgi:hypothetical protein